MTKTLEQLKELMDGKRKPDSEIEDCFMEGYNHALTAADLIEKYIEVSGKLEYNEMKHWHMFILGYAMGQKRLNEEIADFELGNNPLN